MHHAHAFANSILASAHEWWRLMLALFPHPHVLRVVPAAAALIDRQLAQRAQTSTVLTTARLGLKPRRAMKATAHPDIRAAAHAKRRVERPPQLRATEL